MDRATTSALSLAWPAPSVVGQLAAIVALMVLPATTFAVEAWDVQSGGAIPHAAEGPLGSGAYTADRYTFGAGGSSSGGTFSIRGTIGQAYADPLGPSTGGVYEVSGGFWGDAAASTGGGDLLIDGFETP